MADAVRVRFPADGPMCPTLATVYPNPRWLYLMAFFFWGSLTLFRWVLFILDVEVIVYWNAIDCALALFQALWVFWHVLFSHHRWRYLHAQPLGDIKANQITHVLTVLHATEPAEQLYSLVDDLKRLPCEGKKVLLIGMEAVTPEYEERVAMVKSLHGDGFHEILYTVHTLREHEIVGTGSNHYETQVAAQEHFKGQDMSNVIFSKFDTNMRLDKDGLLLREIESVWCMVDPETRKGITFMPNVYWSAAVPDRHRTYMERFVSFTMNTLLQQSTFAMAFVSGSLEGVGEIGYTPPSLLAEDDLTATKKQALLAQPSTYRLCSAILKTFPSGGKDVPQKQWTYEFLDKKMKRWMMGHVEKDCYMSTWIFCRCLLRDFRDKHPPVRNVLRSVFLLLFSIARMYIIFAVPLNMVPCAMLVVPSEFNHTDFSWLTLIQVLPEHFQNLCLRIPVLVLKTGVHEHSLNLFLFFGYWALLPAVLISIVTMVRIQVRVYRSFRFLEFNWRTLMLYPMVFVPVMLVMGPLFLLWSYLKHGILNRPPGHMIVAAPPSGCDCETGANHSQPLQA